MGWVGRLVSLVGGWLVGGMYFYGVFLFYVCVFMPLLYTLTHVSGTLFLDYEVDASFLSSFFLFSPFSFVSFLTISFHFINMGTSGVTLMGAEVLYLSSCCYVFLSFFFPSPSLRFFSFLPSVFNF